MNPKIKNIILFSGIAIAMVLVYVFFIKKAPQEKNLVSTTLPGSAIPSNPNTNTINQNSAVTREFLAVLLSVTSLKLDDSIFSDKAFINLHDSSILLVPTGDEGRPNPFAPIGFDGFVTPQIHAIVAPDITTPKVTP